MEQGATIGRWKQLKRLGEGSLGVSWLAQDTMSGNQAALKLLHEGNSANRQLLVRLAPAVKTARGLEHPGIVPVYQLTEEAERHYILSEYAPIPSLEQMQSGEPMSVEEACRIAVTAADALTYAHGQGMIHANLKPSNILVPPSGTVRLTDFGQAAPIAHSQPSPLLDIVPLYGNAAYIAPELLRGGQASPASDVYALGLILYQMLGGRPAFSGDGASVVQQQLVGHPTPLEELNPPLPAVLVSIVNAAICKDRKVRYPSMAEFAATLREFFIPWYVEQLTHKASAAASPRREAAATPAPPPPQLPTPQAVTSTNRLTPDQPRQFTSSPTRHLVTRRQRDPIVPRPVDYIKGPTLPTRMLSLSEVRSHPARWLLGLALIILIVALVIWAFNSGFVQLQSTLEKENNGIVKIHKITRKR